MSLETLIKHHQTMAKLRLNVEFHTDAVRYLQQFRVLQRATKTLIRRLAR